MDVYFNRSNLDTEEWNRNVGVCCASKEQGEVVTIPFRGERESASHEKDKMREGLGMEHILEI